MEPFCLFFLIMEVRKVSRATIFLSIHIHTQGYASKSASHLGTHQTAIHGSKLLEGLAVCGIIEIIHDALTAHTKLNSFLSDIRYTLHDIINALQLTAQSYLLIRNKEIQVTIIDLINRQSRLYISFRKHF